VKQEISKGNVLSALLAPPCGSFSSANCNVVRTRSDPWGINYQATPKAREFVTIGNRCMKAALSIIHALEAKGIPYILEHPRTSRAWWLPALRRLLRRWHVFCVHLDQCQYGTRWKKATSLLCSRIDICSASRLQKVCHAHKGLCSRTGRPHIQLRGSHPSGVPWTSIAAAYPPGLANDMAHCLVEHVRVDAMAE